MASTIQQFLKEHGISEVEAIIPDMAGVARGKRMPPEKFAEEEGMRLPEAIFLQTVTGDYPEDQSAMDPSDIDIVLKADPKDFEATAELAQTLVASHREDEAIPYYQKLAAETAYPKIVLANIHSKLGDIYAQQNNKAEAVAHYHEAQKLNANDPAAAQGLKKLGEK